MITALTHTVSPEIARCELTYLERQPIQLDRARQQHAAYCELLERCGAQVRQVAVNEAYPDACFIEDVAVVVDEVAVITQMGAASRKGETAGIEPVLREYREVVCIQPPATIEGGDVLRIGRTIYVGLSSRTNADGVEAFSSVLNPFGYHIVPVRVQASLHLKTACTAVGGDILVANPAWVDLNPFGKMRIVHVPEGEPWGANLLTVGETLCIPNGFPRTLALIELFASKIATVDISEFRKAEGGLTCLSLIFEA